MKKIIFFYITFLLFLSSCIKEVKPGEGIRSNPINLYPKTMDEMTVPLGFTYNTSENLNINIFLLANNDSPLKGVRVDIMDNSPEKGGKVLASGITNSSGVLNVNYYIPTYLQEVVINSDYIGVVNNVIAPVTNGKVQIQIGGKNPHLLRTVAPEHSKTQKFLGKSFSRLSYRLGTFSTGMYGGVPNYFTFPHDVVSSQFLADVNASLPENLKVQNHHPQYLSSTLDKNLILSDLCDVWITFLHEGAGYSNALFYFKYPTNNKPSNVSQIDSLISIFPNASYAGSGGGLSTGDKVYIGRVGADTSIGFALASNAWNYTDVNTSGTFYYSIKELNPESDPNKKEHVAFLFDYPTQRFLIGFEDLDREGGTDDDFNDCLVYATATPVSAVDTTHIGIVDHATGSDADGDGVLNAFDDYPNDPLRAYIVYYPSSTTFANVAFEDLWPSKGDHDLNDVVVAYQYVAALNANNKLVNMSAKYKLRAAGGVFHNSFSVELPANRNAISSFSSNSGLSLEVNATKAIINVFGNTKNIIPNYNTMLGSTSQSTDTVLVDILFGSPQNFTLSEFNPFIYINEEGKGRGYEVHLPDHAPTELVNTAVLGTYSDNSNPTIGRYYKTNNNLPFAINIPETFDYPVEREAIINAYLKFAAWAQSGGLQYTNWYQDVSGYRVPNKVYK
ncbi:MAG: LruC domain-containing protein [Bacteroidetes bacterium]|nr:LruC domain-containing protein [Bacteroidota bacterium]